MKDTSLSGDTKIQVFVKSLLFMILFIVLLLVSGILPMIFPVIKSTLMYGTLGTIGGLITMWVFMKIEKRPFASIGMVWETKTPLRFLYGVLIGSFIFALMMLPLLCLTRLTISYKPGPVQWQSLMPYIGLLPLALMEEIGFRSYPQIKLNQKFGIWTSQVVIAAAFGFYHVLNGWGFYNSFTGPFVWAFVYGLASLWSRGIALPTGIHLAVNILQNATGMKPGRPSIWALSYPAGTSQAMIHRTDQVVLALQIALLMIALGATWWYAKTHGRNASTTS